ncbi:putative Enoyl reductase (ER) domain-containing protein [Seiridium cardinale]|uniref:Enoyl reductase (ER) domain-containing protein n=1 Tax=Seiridium cardinale TaxID=138064 RepID=A0ABR2XGZ1_9PEZI
MEESQQQAVDTTEVWDRKDLWAGVSSAAERRQRQNRINQRARPPSDLPRLARLNVLYAFAGNARSLSIPFRDLKRDDCVSSFNLNGPSLPDTSDLALSAPGNLRPTALQRTMVHHPWVDIFPISGMRYNILRGLAAQLFDQDELCIALYTVPNNISTPSPIVANFPILAAQISVEQKYDYLGQYDCNGVERSHFAAYSAAIGAGSGAKDGVKGRSRLPLNESSLLISLRKDHDPEMLDEITPCWRSLFQGWLGLGPNTEEGNFQWGEFSPKTWEDDDVDIEISHYGICATDVDYLQNGSGITLYPCVVGHEIVDKAVRVGASAKHVKAGDRVGLAPTIKRTTARDAYGGYATHNRSKGHFVFPVPDALDSADVAPMMCAGITVYTPLKRNGCGPGKTIDAIADSAYRSAKALGADMVIAVSRKAEKRNDCLEMGADVYIATDDDDDWAIKHARTLDLIVSTASSEHMPLTQYLGLLEIHGSHIQVGTGYGGKLPAIDAFSLLMLGVNIGGSVIGSTTEIREMLQLAADKNI